MKEIVIISGKGGTGKTSLTAAFASLSSNAVFADCDVDAADLHLILNPDVVTVHEFISGCEAVISAELCSACGKCSSLCRFDALTKDQRTGKYSVKIAGCEGCGVCVTHCPVNAISFPERRCGEWYESQTRFGKMVHAKLDIGAENSGKLVSVVRKTARKTAEQTGAELVITDGPPGTGCAVIASVTGATAVVIVTEPTLSGKHDLERVAKLSQHFRVTFFVVINKWDINPNIAEKIKTEARDSGGVFLGHIPYRKTVTEAMIRGLSVCEYDKELSNEIRRIWDTLCQKIQ